MTHERLEQLLRDADTGGDAPAVDATLADRVRARAKRRQRRVRAVGGSAVATACLVATVAIVAWVMRPDAQRTSPGPVIVRATTPDLAEKLRAEMLALSQEADRRAAAAEALWAAEGSVRRVVRRRSTAGTVDVAAQVERAAFTMVYQAARMPAARGAASPAAEVYRQVAQSFPHTASGEVARQRLIELENRKDG